MESAPGFDLTSATHARIIESVRECLCSPIAVGEFYGGNIAKVRITSVHSPGGAGGYTTIRCGDLNPFSKPRPATSTCQIRKSPSLLRTPRRSRDGPKNLAACDLEPAQTSGDLAVESYCTLAANPRRSTPARWLRARLQTRLLPSAALRLEPQQPLQRLLIGVVVFPIAEVWDEVFGDLGAPSEF